MSPVCYFFAFLISISNTYPCKESTTGAFHWGLDGNSGQQSIYITESGGGVQAAVSPNVLPLNTWVHVAFVADGTNVKLYENGVEVASTTYDGTLKTTFLPTFIGAKPDDNGTAPSISNTGFLNGILDEVRIWDAGRTATEIQQNRQVELTGSEPGLEAYYNFNQGMAGADNNGPPAVDTLTDSAGGNDNGTLNNFALNGPTSNWVAPGFPPALSKPNLMAQVGDPAICLDPGGLVGINATVTNPNNVPLAATFTATLPAGLTAVAGSCQTDVAGPCTIAPNGATVSWNGNLAAGQTVNIIYRAQIAANVAPGAQLCIDNAATVGGVPANLQYCFNVVCPVVTNTRVSDQKPGSVLVFPYYTSTVGGATDTRLTITNVSEAAGILANQAFVHLFMIDGATCRAADFYLCLTPKASFSFKASEFDPGITGYLLAVVVNNQGVPIQSNLLIGNAFVQTPEFADNYGAESFTANSFAVATVAGNLATLHFDHVGYDAVPKQFAIELQSPVDAPGQQVVTASLSGNLATGQLSGAAQVGVGTVTNERETPVGSFTNWLLGTCQARATLTTTNPRVPTGMGNLIKSGQGGTMRINVGAAVGLLLTPKTAPWKGIRTLHKTQTVATTLTIPIFIPTCS